MTLNISDSSLDIDKDLVIPKFSLDNYSTEVTCIGYGATGKKAFI